MGDAIVRRIVKERMKRSKKYDRYNLEEEVLTHDGRDVREARAAYIEEEEDILPNVITRKDKMEEYILKMKQYKAEKKEQKEEQLEKFEKMDAEFDELADLLQFRETEAKREEGLSLQKR